MSLNIILEDFVIKVSLLTTSSNTISMVTLRIIVKKMPSSATSRTTILDSRIKVVAGRSNPFIQLILILK